jgi:hypothetical protein
MRYRNSVAARQKIQRLSHGAALELVRGNCSEDWRSDLRRGRLYIYGGLLRYIDAALRQGKSREDLQRIPRWISAYIDESDPANTGELKIVA